MKRANISTVVDSEGDSTIVSAVPAVLKSIYVNEAFSAHVITIESNSVAILTLPVSLAIGVQYTFDGLAFPEDLTVNPDNAMTTGIITLEWAPA